VDQFGREVGEPVEVLCIAVLQSDVLALHPAEVTQPLLEDLDARREARGGAENEKTYPGGFPRRLGLGGERRHEEAEGEEDKESNAVACHGCLLHSRMCRGHSTRHVPGKEIEFCRLNRSNPYRRSADTPASSATVVMSSVAIRVR
jgi:hypothetical protein